MQRVVRSAARTLLLCAALSSSFSGCGSEDTSIDFGEGADPAKPPPKNRPYPCPPQAPMSAATCTVPELSCEYSKGTCKCDPAPMGTFGALAWSCTFDPPSELCPEAQPEAGAPCTSLLDAADCSYGLQLACHCSGETQSWACWNPSDCPHDQPDGDDACEPVGMACRYAAASCECFSRGWTCSDAP